MDAEVFENGHKELCKWNPNTTNIKDPSIYAYFTGWELGNSSITPRSSGMNLSWNIKAFAKAIYHLLGHNRIFSRKINHLGVRVKGNADLNFEKNTKKEENDVWTYAKDENNEEINNGGKKSCGKGNSNNPMGYLYPWCI
ncbi:hypothetical protein Tco_1436094 [Tanacetum coccineum]